MLFLIASLPMMVGLGYIFDLWAEDPEQHPAEASDPEFHDTAMATGDGGETPAFLDVEGVDDRVTGTTEADSISLAGGDDRVSAGDGDDSVQGGTGEDRIDAGGGNDWVNPGPGDDFVRLGDGDDFVLADTGQLEAAAYFDSSGDYAARIDNAIAETFAGNDTYFAGDGEDFIVDPLGSNLIRGQGGEDDLSGLDQSLGNPDTIEGGYNRDILRGDDGDSLTGDGGQDVFVLHQRDGGAPIVVTDFNPADDYLALYDQEGNELTAEQVQDGNDVLLMSDGQTIARLQDLAMDDLQPQNFRTGGEYSWYDPRSGTVLDDFVQLTQQGTSRFHALTGDDTVIGHEGNDHVSLYQGDDLAYGGDGNDDLEGWIGNDSIFGGEGDDMYLSGGAGDDYLDGGPGNDRLNDSDEDGPAGHDTLLGGTGDDDISSHYNFSTISGGDGSDVISSTDSYRFLGRADSVDGGAGDDEIHADDGDTVTGGDGSDSFAIFFADQSAEMVTITDYDFDAGDVLVIEVFDGRIAAPLDETDLEISSAEDGASLLVSLGEYPIALVQGESDPDALDILVRIL